MKATHRTSTELLTSLLDFDPQFTSNTPSSFVLRQIAAATTRSRYRADFQEIKMLGKGGFGQVWHVLNYVDNQHYAMKRIPLNRRMAHQLHTSGLDGLENVLREIRTLARLEHCNVVRYFNAWIEAPQPPATIVRQPVIAAQPLPSTSQLQPLPGTSLIGGGELANNDNLETAIVFEADSRSKEMAQPPADVSTCAQGNSSPIASLLRLDPFSDGSPGDHPSFDHDSSTYMLYVQMSMHPMTLRSYLCPSPARQTTTAPLTPSPAPVYGAELATFSSRDAPTRRQDQDTTMWGRAVAAPIRRRIF